MTAKEQLVANCSDADGNAAEVFGTRRCSCGKMRRIPDSITSTITSRSTERKAMTKLTLRDLEVRGKRVLVRVDFNVPTEERDGKIVITDDTRIRESLPTINYLREHGAKTILMAHFGRPKGKPVEKYSLRPVGRLFAHADQSAGRFQSRHHRRDAGKNCRRT